MKPQAAGRRQDIPAVSWEGPSGHSTTYSQEISPSGQQSCKLPRSRVMDGMRAGPGAGPLTDPDSRKFRPTPIWSQKVPEGTWQNFVPFCKNNRPCVWLRVNLRGWHCPAPTSLTCPGQRR